MLEVGTKAPDFTLPDQNGEMHSLEDYRGKKAILFMWKCPRCGRTFRNENQQHYCGRSPENIDEYIAEQPEEIQSILIRTRTVLRDALPDCQEKISWSMPTYWKKRNIIHFAAQKAHLGIYPGADAIEAFADRLTGYKTTKGAIQFPYKKEIPYGLISEIAQWAYQHNI